MNASASLVGFSRLRRAAAAALLLLAAATAHADGPSTATRAAWRQYIASAEARIAREVADRQRPLLIDTVPGAAGERARVVGGEIVAAEMPPQLDAGRPIDVPDGRVHHWRGAVYLPRITVNALLDIVQANPEDHKQPDVIRARMISRQGDRLRLFLQIQRTQIVTVTYNTEHDLVYQRPYAGFATSRAEATRIVEVADAGTAREREKPEGDDHGFLWGLNAYWRYLQVGDGVLVECESLSLSREVPVLVRPLVVPLVDRIARESMRRTLDALRARVAAHRR